MITMLCSLCQSKEATYLIDSLEPVMGFCDTCKPSFRRLILRQSQCGESEPDYKYETDFPKEKCIFCGNDNIKELNRTSISRAPMVYEFGVTPIELPKSIEFERWSCKMGIGCGKKFYENWY